MWCILVYFLSHCVISLGPFWCKLHYCIPLCPDIDHVVPVCPGLNFRMPHCLKRCNRETRRSYRVRQKAKHESVTKGTEILRPLRGCEVNALYRVNSLLLHFHGVAPLGTYTCIVSTLPSNVESVSPNKECSQDHTNLIFNKHFNTILPNSRVLGSISIFSM